MTDATTIDLQAELTLRYDDEHTFPFVEDENANITGYGHQDKAAFADQVNRYDEVCGGGVDPEDRWTAEDITHLWAELREHADGDWRLHKVPAGTPGAVPVTTLWGQR